MRNILIFLWIIFSSTLYAATWNLDASGNWNVNGNWTAPSIFPNGIDSTANFGNVITANRIISLGAAAQNITVGTLTFDSANNYTIQSGSGTNTLIFDVSAGTASLNVTSVNGAGSHSITCPVTLNDTLSMTHSSTADFTISGAIGGTGGLTKNGTGTGSLILSGTTANTYTGLTTVNAGTLLLNKTAGINAIAGNAQVNTGGTLALGAANQISNTSILTLNGGTFNMNANAETLGSLVFSSGTLTQGGATLSLANATPTALSMSDGTLISGPLAFTAAGGATYTGATTRATISGDVNLGTFAHTFNIANGADTVDMDLSGIISGTGSVTKSTGTGVLRYSGSSPNTYTGLTTINAGELILNKTAGVNALAGNATINTGGTLSLAASDQIANTALVTITGGTFNLAGFAETINQLTFNSGTLSQGGATLNLASNVTALAMGNGATITGNINLTGTGAISYTGTTTSATISGNLDIGSATHDFVIANGTASSDLIISGVISGTGGFRFISGTIPARVEFSGNSANTYTGLTTISRGTLFLNKTSGNAVLGNITMNDGDARLTLGGPNQIANTSTLTESGGIFDMGGFSDTIGTYTFSGGTLTQGGGTLSLNSAVTALTMRNTTINGNIAILNGGAVVFNPASGGTATINGNIDLGTITPLFNIPDGPLAIDMAIPGTISSSGAGLTKTGTGVLSFSGAAPNTYTGLTTVTAGTLLLNKTPGINAITGNVFINGGTLTLSAANQIANTSTVTLSSGTFNLGFQDTLGTFDFQGGTFNQSTTLSLANGGTALSMRDTTIFGDIDILNGGSVVFDNTNNGTATITGNMNLSGFTTTYNIADGTAPIDMLISGIISNGGLTKTGSGTLLLTGPNTYSGGTLVSAGTLQGDTTSLQNNITNNANLVFDQAVDGTYSDMISGTGNFIKEGAGNLVLSNINSAGGAAVNSGTLTVNGTLGGGGAMTVASGAILAGTGTITKNTTINGTLAPGDTGIGTIHLIGNQVFTSGSALEIEFNASTRDLLDIIGNLSIQPGSTLKLFPELDNYPDNFSYTITQATGGIVGQFSTVTSLPLFNVDVVYNGFTIALVRITVLPFSEIIKQGNASIIARCLDALPSTPGSDLAFVKANLLMMPTIGDLQQALLQLQPSAFTSLVIAQENNTLQMKNAIYNHLEIQPHSFGLYENNKTGFWISPLGATATEHDRNQEPGFRADTKGIVGGFDFLVNERSNLGIGLGYDQTNLDWAQSRGTADIKSTYVEGYGRFANSHAYLLSSLIGGFNNYSTNRYIEFYQIDREATGHHNGLEGSFHLKGALMFGDPWMIFSPFISADYIYLHESGFKEKGAQSLNLKVKGNNSDLFAKEIGIQLSRTFKNEKVNSITFIRFSAIRESRFRGHDKNALLACGCSSKIVCSLDTVGLNPSRTVGGIAAGINLEFSHSALSIFYQGKYGNGLQDNSIYLQYQW